MQSSNLLFGKTSFANYEFCIPYSQIMGCNLLALKSPISRDSTFHFHSKIPLRQRAGKRFK